MRPLHLLIHITHHPFPVVRVVDIDDLDVGIVDLIQTGRIVGIAPGFHGDDLQACPSDLGERPAQGVEVAVGDARRDKREGFIGLYVDSIDIGQVAAPFHVQALIGLNQSCLPRFLDMGGR